jgi:hypothetical protein
MGSAVFAYFYQQAMSKDPKITGAQRLRLLAWPLLGDL